MGNLDLLFIFTLNDFKDKLIIKGSEYNHICEALVLATQRLEAQWKAHNERSCTVEGQEEGREWVDYRIKNVQIEELPL